MAKADADLRRLQHWMQTVTTHPHGVRVGISSPEAQQASLGSQPSGIVRPSATLSSEQRLEIYGQAYGARLLECFRAEYPCLRFALGDELFREFVGDYLHHHPPTSYTLFDLGRSFPGHLAQTRPAACRETGEREDWPDFIVDLASLERAFMEVFDGAGIERQETVGVEEIQGRSDEELFEARFRTAPCLRLLSFAYPVNDYFEDYRAGLQPPLPAAQSVCLAVTRRQYIVRFYQLSPAEHQLLAALSRGAAIRESFAALAGDDRSIAKAALRNWLVRWTSWQFFLSIGQ